MDRDDPAFARSCLTDLKHGRVCLKVYVRLLDPQRFGDCEPGPPLDTHTQPGNRVRHESDERLNFIGFEKLGWFTGIRDVVAIRSGVERPNGLDWVRNFVGSPTESRRTVKAQVLLSRWFRPLVRSADYASV